MLMTRIIPTTGLFILILLTGLVYWPGLQGGFLFDDQSNLAGLAHYRDSGQWKDIQQFITSGFAGPTGRPIALATFIPQAYSWPISAYPFKLVNLAIHLSCGILIYWTIRLILLSYGYIEKKATWIALLSCGFWLLHPFFVSTTLYVIQRMAQLPLLFSLLGMIGYLRGRALLTRRPLHAYIIMTLSISISSILATYSKENGALLPLLILIIEFCNPTKVNKPIWYWRAICLWMPSTVIAALLFHYIDFSENPWPYRSFNQAERLWSEARIICSYLYQLFIPRIEGYGLFQDGYYISKGWLNPVTTLISIIFIIFLLGFAFAIRKKYPLICLAILFFFAAHLIESSVIGLELYFEHRNYVAAIFLFLPIAAGLYNLSERTKSSSVIFISCLILIILAWMTWQRVILWSDTTKLQVYWAQNNPESVRAQSKLAEILMQHGRSQEANQVLEQAIACHPDSSLLIQLLKQKIDIGKVSKQDFLRLQHQILKQNADGAAIWGLRGLVDKIIKDQKLTRLYAQEMTELLTNLIKYNKSYRDYPNFYALSNYLQAQLFAALELPHKAYQNYLRAAVQYRDVSAALAMVADLGNKGYYKLALQLLTKIELIYQKQLKDEVMYKRIAEDLRKNIQADMEADKMHVYHKDK
ncbi:tetratricopeptide repeat protein [Alkanindiges illinoisensis]|uniref:tetratricopeptide repeat protein n=1 Tax=Alkanindiges illinoisensis TaxID=197183 RepID=UPI000AD95BB6|nr:tetratricopeptide repeat protein [Alkanindiges illinoisensis]